MFVGDPTVVVVTGPAHLSEVLVACARRDADTWRDGETIDMARETTRITMSVAGKPLFGADTFSEADELGTALTEMIAWSGRLSTSWLPVALIALRDVIERAAAGRAEDRRMRAAVALLDRRVQRMIDDRRAEGPAAPRRSLVARGLRAPATPLSSWRYAPVSEQLPVLHVRASRPACSPHRVRPLS